MDESATIPAKTSKRRALRFGKSMMPVFAALAATLLTLALVIGQTIVAQRDARTQAMTEGDTLLGLNQLMAATLDGETGQRGYLLTNKAEYLTPYLDARQRRDRAMARLREVTSKLPDAAFSARLTRVDRLTDARFAEMDRSVALAQAGLKDQALALIQADFGKLQMDVIRSEIAALNHAKAEQRRAAFTRAAALERRLLPLIGILGLAILALIYTGFRSERSRSLAQAEAEQAGPLREANERIELLARELNHRVKNLFSVILSIVSLSGRKQAPSREIVDDIRARIRALSLAHSASLGGHGADRVELGPVIARTMEPYADEGGRRVRIAGPKVDLPARMVTPLGLIVHELATNAVKYGALSVEGGTVAIGWEVGEDAALLVLSWIETGGPAIDAAAAQASGFGSQMTTLAAGQLGGTIERDWPATGAVVRLTIPLDGA